ncbi:MAG TPA: enolase C-terminal domain-like protein, partial [Chloroflexota bacterium]|nr:enolase C-terminal domain-like protein [Chloroflexota bacterium]
MALTIASGEVFAFRLPMRTTFRTSRGVVGGEQSGRTVVLVKLSADDGTSGWGEASPVAAWSPETVPSVVGALRYLFLPAVASLPVADLDGLHRAMDAVVAPLWGLSLPIARAGIDIAAHDLLARSLGVPLATLLGLRRRDQVQLSWTVTGATPDAVETSVAEGRQRGYRSANIKVGGSPAWDVELCTLVRRLLPSGYLWGDANGGMPVHAGPARAAALEAAGLDLLEQPFAPDRSSACAALLPQLHVPLALDEPVTGPSVLHELLTGRCLSALALKVTRNGGLLPSRRCADIAEAAGLLLVSSGLTDAGVAFAANVQLAAAYGV